MEEELMLKLLANIGVPNTKTIGCGMTPFLMRRLKI